MLQRLRSRFGNRPALQAAPVTEADVIVAYRVILGREPDAEGLRASVEHGARAGLTLAQLIEILRQSDEYRARRAAPPASPAKTEAHARAEAPAPADTIRPADVLAKYTLSELNETADEYYRRISDPSLLMSKPFANWPEAPQMLHDLGLLLSGLHLGKGMTVLDFGGGTGWLSRILAQLNCQAICCDVSRHALEIGRAAYERYPPIGTAPYAPRFLLFDGLRMDLPDASVDRIICFDAFHHVPNASAVIAEFARVLRPGGIAGFSEPGPKHSQSPQSQYEMRHHRVLENDIDLREIAALAGQAGFTSVTAKALVDRDLSLAEYEVVVRPDGAGAGELREALWQSARATMTNRSVFYLHKGDLTLDSRSHVGLAHTIRVISAPTTVAAGQPFSIDLAIVNSGETTWLHENSEIFGIVRIGTHLYRDDGTLLELDFTRHALPRRVPPRDQITLAITLAIGTPGRYRVEVDLVAEGVTWFENVGSEAVSFHVTVS